MFRLFPKLSQNVPHARNWLKLVIDSVRRDRSRHITILAESSSLLCLYRYETSSSMVTTPLNIRKTYTLYLENLKNPKNLRSMPGKPEKPQICARKFRVLRVFWVLRVFRFFGFFRFPDSFPGFPELRGSGGHRSTSSHSRSTCASLLNNFFCSAGCLWILPQVGI